MNAERRAWNEFWKEQNRNGSACLQRAPSLLVSALAQHWRAFAAHLPLNATILDLGCGSGAVGRALTTSRSDLRLHGIDFAELEGVQNAAYASVEANTAMERLPFENRRFFGAASQFGFEYSRIQDSVTELARVMVPGAPLSLIVHHAEGPIVIDNRRSLRAYQRLLSPEMERLFLTGHRAAVEDGAIAAASSACDPTVAFVAQALRERVSEPRSVRTKSWLAVKEALMPELVLATALDRSAISDASIDRWLAHFGDYFEDLRASPLEAGGMPFAWRVYARRSKAPMRRSTLTSPGTVLVV
jgi:ubiquinone/menaquinone biosynthesis C-methylase UbiE